MKKRGNKKTRCSILGCAVSIMLTVGMITGCSAKESAPSKMQTSTSHLSEEATPFEQMEGSWIIDFDKTDESLWGSGISTGNGMEISQTGEFSYYIGIGVGGTGQCEDKYGEITVEIQPYEEHSSEKEILGLEYKNDNEEESILMNWHDEDVFWKRKSEK